MKNFKTIVLLLIGVVLITSGFQCKLVPTKTVPENLTQTVELEYWGVWDDSDYLAPIIADFNALHPNIKITYKKFRYAEYEQKLLEAWAEDRGPDMYSLPAAWLKKYQNRITPEPSSVQLAFKEVKETLGKTEVNTVVKSVPIYTPTDIKSKFVDVVYNDVVIDGQVYGLPYSVDTLALYYNRDMLDAAGVAVPPTTWTELKEAVKKITQIDQNNNLIQSGIAMGTADNISNASDIVSLLMMQNGTQMVNEKNQVTFQLPSTGDNEYYPGLEALRFYTDFADPVKEVYSWNSSQNSALDAFISGKLAMMFGYSYNLPVIKGRAPKLDFSIQAMPQIQGLTTPIHYTNYWVETVSHKTAYSQIAWGFLNFAMRGEEIEKYLNASKKPTALRALINSQKEDPEIAIFAGQSLTAKRWYTGADALKMEEIFKEMITEFPESLTPLELMSYTAKRIDQTY